MSWRPKPGWNPTPYALAAIGILIVGTGVGVIAPALAVFLVVIVVAAMSWIRKRAASATGTKSGWSTAGTVLAALAAVGGLAILGIVVLLVVAFSTCNLKIGNK